VPSGAAIKYHMPSLITLLQTFPRTDPAWRSRPDAAQISSVPGSHNRRDAAQPTSLMKSRRLNRSNNADHKGGTAVRRSPLCGVLPLALARRDRARCLADHIEHHVRLRQHGHMARRDLGRGGFHAFRSEALQIGMNCLVLGGEDIRTRLCLPRGTFDLLIE